jgi:hypothetical protein
MDNDRRHRSLDPELSDPSKRSLTSSRSHVSRGGPVIADDDLLYLLIADDAALLIAQRLE